MTREYYSPIAPNIDQFPRVPLTGLSSYSFNAAAGLDTTIHRKWVITLEDIVPSVARDLLLQFSGVTSADYATIQEYRKTNASGGTFESAANTALGVTVSNIDEAGQGVNGEITVFSGTAQGGVSAFSRVFYEDNSDFFTIVKGHLRRLTAGVLTSIDFSLSGAGTFVRGALYIEAYRRLG